MTETQQFHTSIPKLDAALDRHLDRGEFIVVAGLQGGGKTILAAQLSRKFAADGLKVLYVSTEVTLDALYKRNMAAIGSIAYDRVMDGMNTVAIPGEGGLPIHLPDPAVYGEEAVKAAYPVLTALGKHFTFVESSPSGYEPRPEIERILTGYKEQHATFPDVLVYDFLCYPKVNQTELDAYKIRQAVVDAAQLLKATAAEHQMLVVAFCQADPSLAERKKIDPSGMFDLKAVWEHATAFVGISQRLRDESGDLTEGLYERVQHLNVLTKTSSAPVLVPVERAFEYQRFDPCRWRPKQKPEDRGELEKLARVIERTSEYPGYVMARRKKFYEIFDIGYPHVINLYAFLLLVAGTRGWQEGVSFYSRQTLTDALGLSSKQLRSATDFITDRGYVDVPPPGPRQSLRYRIEEWKNDQRPSTKGYFKLFRNLRDASRADLIANPATFRVWLRLLSDARSFPEENLELEPGEVLLKRKQMQDTLQIGTTQLDAALGRLQDRGSIVPKSGSPGKLVIPNWDLYQTRVYGSSSGASDEEA